MGSLNVKAKNISSFLKNKPVIDLKGYEVMYVGQWRHGAMSGVGKLARKGEIYYGQFVEGNYEGDGMIWEEGGQ